ncbi:acyl-CoA dehydrogenase family protein [Nocardioides cheoyonin]|uniref:acyl-CoA dehydrogenase family protein n=1 Tax=Nocardioides cheoyonin TaxID=3156615 RepID=UPI0032B58BDC
MTPRPTIPTPLLAELLADYAPLLEKIAAGALEREVADELPREPMRWLADAGLGALRLPVEYGGRGASFTELTQLWVEIAAADANLVQAFRGHFACLEDRLWQHRHGHDQSRWLERFAAGQIAGNAFSEVGTTQLGTQQTVIVRQPDGTYRLDGTKYYTTGTIFADWVEVYVQRHGDPVDELPDGDEFASVVVAVTDPGVTVVDDWDGFGQRGTGSGTTSFDGVLVEPADVVPFGRRFGYQTALNQLNLLATLAGIGRAAVRDAAEAVRGRERNYSHANAARVRDDPQVLDRVGQIAAKVYAAEAAVVRVATAVDEAAAAPPGGFAAVNEIAEIESAAAQVAVTDLVLSATTELFDTLGASATARGSALDRHWRNARTVSSHNPRILKSRVVGDHLVNGTPPPYRWRIGATERDQAWAGR